MQRLRGFTIVELLITLVVLSILVTLGTVAWQSTRRSAVDSSTKTDVARLKDAIERYYRDNGEYPIPGGCNGPATATRCDNGQLASLLVPKYIPSLPLDRNKEHFKYAASRPATADDPMADKYGLLVTLYDGNCRSGKNMDNWWGIPACNF